MKTNKAYKVVYADERFIKIRISFLRTKTFQFNDPLSQPIEWKWVKLERGTETGTYTLTGVEFAEEPPALSYKLVEAFATILQLIASLFSFGHTFYQPKPPSIDLSTSLPNEETIEESENDISSIVNVDDTNKHNNPFPKMEESEFSEQSSRQISENTEEEVELSDPDPDPDPDNVPKLPKDDDLNELSDVNLEDYFSTLFNKDMIEGTDSKVGILKRIKRLFKKRG